MAVDSYDPTTGHPIFLDTGAPDVGLDPTEVAKYAAKVGTRLIGPTEEREAYPYTREGLLWRDTSDGVTYEWRSGAWVHWLDSGWVPVSAIGSGWSSTGSAYQPRVRRVGNRVDLAGAITRTTTAGALTNFVTVPPEFRHTGLYGTYYIGTVVTGGANGGQAVTLVLDGAGVVRMPGGQGYITDTMGSGVVLPLVGSWYVD